MYTGQRKLAGTSLQEDVATSPLFESLLVCTPYKPADRYLHAPSNFFFFGVDLTTSSDGLFTVYIVITLKAPFNKIVEVAVCVD